MSNFDYVIATKQITLKGKELKIGKLSIGDLADYRQFCKDYKKRELIGNYKLIDKEVTIEDIEKVEVTEEDIDKIGEEIEGTIFLLYKIINKYQDITIKELENIITPDDLKQTQEIISYAISSENNIDNKKKQITKKNR